MIDVRIDGLGWVTIVCPKYTLVLSREEFITALRRAKAWKRHRTLEQRLANTARGSAEPLPLLDVRRVPCLQRPLAGAATVTNTE